MTPTQKGPEAYFINKTDPNQLQPLRGGRKQLLNLQQLICHVLKRIAQDQALQAQSRRLGVQRSGKCRSCCLNA